MCVKHFVTRVAKQSTMTGLSERETLFKSLPYALEAIDVTFQKANRPTGNMQEEKGVLLGKAQALWVQGRSCSSSEWNSIRSQSTLLWFGVGYQHHVSPISAACRDIKEERRRL